MALKWAWEHGASEWSDNKTERFANDPVNPLPVEASLNPSKGSQGPINGYRQPDNAGTLRGLFAL